MSEGRKFVVDVLIVILLLCLSGAVFAGLIWLYDHDLGLVAGLISFLAIGLLVAVAPFENIH